MELFILLFADDIILLPKTVTGLQTQLNSLCHAASDLKLKINMNKSNIIVFRKGGYLVSHERWFYDDMKIGVVNSYKYLGISFTTKLSFTNAGEELVCRGKKAVIDLDSFLLMYSLSYLMLRCSLLYCTVLKFGALITLLM